MSFKVFGIPNSKFPNTKLVDRPQFCPVLPPAPGCDITTVTMNNSIDITLLQNIVIVYNVISNHKGKTQGTPFFAWLKRFTTRSFAMDKFLVMNSYVRLKKRRWIFIFVVIVILIFMHVQLISEKVIYNRSRTLTVENWRHLLNLRVPGFPESLKKHSWGIVNRTHSSS